MTDKEHYELINKFINDSSIVKGGGFKVTVSCNSTSMSPRKGFIRYEDCEMVRELLPGANQLLFYLRRNGYKIKKPK